MSPSVMRGAWRLWTLLVFALSGCVQAPVAEHPPAKLAIVQSWSGDFPVVELKRLPQGQQQSRVGYLASSTSFGTVWSVFKPGEAVPSVDFSRHMVVFVRNVDFYNRTAIAKIELKEGVLAVQAVETLSALPIEDRAAMAMAVIPRQGVRFIKSGPASIPVPQE
jgi:hypothetical protein